MSSPSKVGVWGQGSSGADAASFVWTTTRGVTKGNLIVIFNECRSASGTAFTSLVPTDNAAGGSNVYTQLLSSAPQNNCYFSVYYAIAKNTETLTITQTPSNPAICSGIAIEITGQNATTPINVSALTHGTSVSGTAFAVTSVTTTVAGCLILGGTGYLGNAALSAQTFAPAGTGQVNETTILASGAHNNASALSETLAGAAGAQTFQATIAAAVAYACAVVAVAGTSGGGGGGGGGGVGNQKSPSIGCLMRSSTQPTGALAASVHGFIGECHWGAQGSDKSANAMQPDPQPTGGWGTAIAGDGSSKGGAYNANGTFTNYINGLLLQIRNYNKPSAGNVRVITDGTTAAGGVNVTSPTQANFTSADVGKFIYGPGIIPGTTIQSVNTSSTITLSTTATATGTKLTLTIGAPQTLRLRVESGIHSPNWVYALDGAPTTGVAITSNSGNTGFAPKWWKSGCQTAYANLIQGLAKLPVYKDTTQTTTIPLDQCPEIRECVVGLTMLFFGEVFFRFAGTGNNDANMVNAGFTTQLDYNAMKFMMDTHIKYFLNTITMLDCNKYDNYAGAGTTPFIGMPFTQSIMDYSVLRTGPVGIEFTNASLGPSTNATLYGVMKNYGPLGTGDATRNNTAAISFQSYPVGQGGVTTANFATVLAYAVTWGASSVEIISGPTVSTLSPGDANLQSNFRHRPRKLAVVGR